MKKSPMQKYMEDRSRYDWLGFICLALGYPMVAILAGLVLGGAL